MKKYCYINKIQDNDIDRFCKKMTELSISENIVDWNNEANNLSITGLGDPLPETLIKKYPNFTKKIDLITQNIREISGFQMFGKWIHSESINYLLEIFKICNIKLDLTIFFKYKYGEDGWGYVFNKDDYNAIFEIYNLEFEL